MRVLIWHWGRFGAGPRYAAALARHLRDVSGIETLLSLPRNAEILVGGSAPVVDLPVQTYRGLAGFAWRAATAPFRIGPLARRIRALRPDVAICAMPAMLDLLMAAALRRAQVPIAVVVHDAAPHLGERVPMQHRLQRTLLRRAKIIITLSAHVAQSLRAQGLLRDKILLQSRLPLLDYTAEDEGAALTERAPGPTRLLFFGRLLPYKGLDLLAESLRQLGTEHGLSVRVVGQGPDSPELAALRALPHVTVENRWVPESEVAALLAWSDTLILPYRAASQSGVAAAALASGRMVIATRVGGLTEQLEHVPGARLCAPDAASLADALRDLRTPPMRFAPPSDAKADWAETSRELAAGLAQHCSNGLIGTVQGARPRASP